VLKSEPNVKVREMNETAEEHGKTESVDANVVKGELNWN
jgi:hypothetical protein